MRFDLNLRSAVREQMQALAQEMHAWQVQIQIDEFEAICIRNNIFCFTHTTSRSGLRVAGVDGSGDFPMLTYADSFIYLSVAQATVYEADRISGLREQAPIPETLIHLAWIPENTIEGPKAIDQAHTQLAGLPLLDIITDSDYHQLKSKITGKKHYPKALLKGLIRPHASDIGNLAIQLRTTAELGAALRLIESEHCPHYLLMDTTFSLPLLASTNSSLFYEHLKRLCCVKARKQGIGFFTLSKSHGLPAMETLETLAAQIQGLPPGQVAEHWYLRIPELYRDNWSLSLTEGRRIPPPGAVSYLLRFHRLTPVLRLDMDREYWENFVKGDTEEETRQNERKIFEDLDYASHDQRVYGYPYPIKAAHDRASLTDAERVALRKQLIAQAIATGMSPALFRDPSQATGHR